MGIYASCHAGAVYRKRAKKGKKYQQLHANYLDVAAADEQEKRLIEQDDDDVPFLFLRASKEAAAVSQTKSNLAALLRVGKLVLTALSKPGLRSTAEGDFSIADFAFLQSHWTLLDADITTTGQTTTITTTDLETATKMVTVPNGPAMLRVSAYRHPGDNPTIANPAVLSAMADAHVADGDRPEYDESPEFQQRAMIHEGMFDNDLGDLPLEVQSTTIARVDLEGGFIVTVQNKNLYFTIKVTVRKSGFKRRFRDAKGGGGNYWHNHKKATTKKIGARVRSSVS